MASSALKRMFDVATAGAALVVGAPLLGLLCVAVRVDSKGAALFRQQRVGRGGKQIETLKLRTMVSDAPKAGLAITATGDPRVTRVGRLLRKTKLDELPQLWNVVRGDMSLVGPRPEVPRYVETYEQRWKRLLDVRPGLTDLASLVFRHEESLLASSSDHDRAYREVIMPLKLGLALEGVAASSFAYDIAIIARTIAAVLWGHNPRSDVFEEARRRVKLLEANES